MYLSAIKTETKVLIGVLIGSLVLLSGAVVILSKPKPTINSSVLEIDYSGGQKIGSDSAKVKLVEFSDFQCPACLAYEPTVRAVISENKDNPNFQFIYRHFPLTQHIHSREAANLAEYAAGQGKFWQMHGKLFETQDEWSSLPDVSDFFADLAKQLSLDEAGARDAVAKSIFNDKINADVDEGQRLGLQATPTFYLNGRALDLKTIVDLKIQVEEELKK